MTKQEFLDALRARLTQLPREELDKQTAYFSEMIDDMTEDGLDEAEAVSRLGDVSETAESILQELPLSALVRSRVRPKSGWSVLSIVLLVLGSPVWLPIGLALFAVVLSVYIVIWAVIVVLFAAVLAIGVSGLGLIAMAFINIGGGFAPFIMALGAGVACAGLSIFAFLGSLQAAKGLVRLTALIARGIKSLFIRKEAVQ